MDVNRVPECEYGVLQSVCAMAASLAACGALDEGLVLMESALRGAESLERHAVPWASELVACYREAISAYCRTWGVRVEPEL